MHKHWLLKRMFSAEDCGGNSIVCCGISTLQRFDQRVRYLPSDPLFLVLLFPGGVAQLLRLLSSQTGDVKSVFGLLTLLVGDNTRNSLSFLNFGGVSIIVQDWLASP